MEAEHHPHISDRGLETVINCAHAASDEETMRGRYWHLPRLWNPRLGSVVASFRGFHAIGAVAPVVVVPQSFATEDHSSPDFPMLPSLRSFRGQQCRWVGLHLKVLRFSMPDSLASDCRSGLAIWPLTRRTTQGQLRRGDFATETICTVICAGREEAGRVLLFGRMISNRRFKCCRVLEAVVDRGVILG